MSSSEGNTDDVASSCNSRLPQQPDEGISESTFRQLLVDFAKWYDRIGYISMLKVLYRDHVTIYNELNEATDVMSLLRMLIGSGKLSSTNLTILYDTIIVTEQFGFKSISLLPSFQNIKEREVVSFTMLRKKIFGMGIRLTKENIKTLDGQCNAPYLMNYRDSWSLILDLEQREELCEEKLDEFVKALPSSSLTDTALFEGYVEEEARSKSHARQQPDKDITIREYLLTQQKNACYNASQFTPAIMNNRYHVDIQHMFTDLDLLKGNLNQPGATSTTLEEVLGIVKSSPACKVLIEGEAGIGKSTFLRYVAYSWARESDETFKGKIVFLVNMRDVNKDKTILDTILKQIDLEDYSVKTKLSGNTQIIKEFIMNHDDEIVLLLDGLDELRKGSESPIIYFNKTKMKNIKVMLTSRCEQIDEFISKSDVHVQVKGFSEDNMGKYIKKHFNYMEMPTLADSLILKLHEKDVIHSEVFSMCKNPMLLLAICNMWEDKQCLPNDKADLCKEVFRCILNQFNKQTPNSQKFSRFEDIPEYFINPMLVLGKCMYEGLKNNQLYINKKHLEGSKETVDLALNLGFVYKDAPSSKGDFEMIFTAPHKFIVESLVGFYLYKVCQAAELENNEDEMDNVLKPLNESEWNIIRESEHLNTANTLAVKFLGANAAKYLNHWITNNWSTYHDLMLLYLEHTAEEHKEIVEKELIDYMNETDLELKQHIGDVCYSLRKCIHYFNPSVRVSEDEHFIKLMRIVSLEHIDVQTFLEKLCGGDSAKNKYRLYAHMLVTTHRHNFVDYICDYFEGCIHNDAVYVLDECERLNFNFHMRFTYLHLGGALINTSYLVYILSNSPKLYRFILYFDYGVNDKSGVIINDTIKQCVKRGVNLLGLRHLIFDGGNLCKIDGSLLAELLSLTPKLSYLYMANCNLSGVIMNDMIRACSRRGVQLREHCSIQIGNNNFSDIDGSLLASFLTNSPKPECIYMSNCRLSAVIMHDMIRACSSRGVKLECQLDITGNNFSKIEGSLLASLFLTIASKSAHIAID